MDTTPSHSVLALSIHHDATGTRGKDECCVLTSESASCNSMLTRPSFRELGELACLCHWPELKVISNGHQAHVYSIRQSLTASFSDLIGSLVVWMRNCNQCLTLHLRNVVNSTRRHKGVTLESQRRSATVCSSFLIATFVCTSVSSKAC